MVVRYEDRYGKLPADLNILQSLFYYHFTIDYESALIT